MKKIKNIDCEIKGNVYYPTCFIKKETINTYFESEMFKFLSSELKTAYENSLTKEELFLIKTMPPRTLASVIEPILMKIALLEKGIE